jgi:hypothetical protein
MEGSDGVIRGTVDSLMKLVAAIEAAGVELIREGDISSGGGRGVRLREAAVAKRAQLASRSRIRAPRRSGGIRAAMSRSS